VKGVREVVCEKTMKWKCGENERNETERNENEEQNVRKMKTKLQWRYLVVVNVIVPLFVLVFGKEEVVIVFVVVVQVVVFVVFVVVVVVFVVVSLVFAVIVAIVFVVAFGGVA
jgi:K+-sensing histidine kinase KdpD